MIFIYFSPIIWIAFLLCWYFFLTYTLLPIIIFLFIFNWRISALWCCVGFCRASTWSNHRYTHVPSLLNLRPTSHPSIVSWCTKFLIVIKSNVKYLSFVTCSFGAISKWSLPNPMLLDFCPAFFLEFLEFYYFRSYT